MPRLARLDMSKYITDEIAARFSAKVAKASTGSGCWIWTGGKDHTNAGVMSLRKNAHNVMNLRVHHIAAFVYLKTDTSKVSISRSCKNKLCCNPDHLVIKPLQKSRDDALREARKHLLQNDV